MKKKFIISLIILVTVLFSFAIINFQKGTDQLITFNDVTVRGEDYQAIKEKFGDEAYIHICNLEKGNCILLTNLEYFS